MSFEELVKKVSPTLKRITYKLNGHFSFFNDEDLYQEALVHLWLDFKDGKLQDKTDSYILQGCYFHLKNYLRKVRVKANLVSIESLVDDEGNTREDYLPAQEASFYFDYLDNKILVENILGNGLTAREKEVLSLCLEGLTVREIGKRLGISHVRIVKIRTSIKRKSNYLFDRE